MLLKAKILKAEVIRNIRYDPRTGTRDPSSFLEATILDIETDAEYRCSFRDAYAEQLRRAYLEKWPEAERDALARDIETRAKQERENREMLLEVVGIRPDKDSITLLVRPIEEDQGQR